MKPVRPNALLLAAVFAAPLAPFGCSHPAPAPAPAAPPDVTASKPPTSEAPKPGASAPAPSPAEAPSAAPKADSPRLLGNEVSCEGLLDSLGRARASSDVKAAIGWASLGGQGRFEIFPSGKARYITSNGFRRTRCFEADLPPKNVATFTRTLMKSRLCSLGSKEIPHPDEGYMTFEADLPGVSCKVEFAPHVAFRGNTRKPQYGTIFDAFGALENWMCEGGCENHP